jgi:hypothetical protein
MERSSNGCEIELNTFIVCNVLRNEHITSQMAKRFLAMMVDVADSIECS